MNLNQYIYKDGDNFYLDTEGYDENQINKLSIDFDEGDLIRWTWEGKKMMGTLQRVNYNGDLFLLKNISVL